MSTEKLGGPWREGGGAGGGEWKGEDEAVRAGTGEEKQDCG